MLRSSFVRFLLLVVVVPPFLFPAVDAAGSEGELHVLVDTVLTEGHQGPILVRGAVLDCAGHSVTPSQGTPSIVGIFVGSDATVRNCRVSGFEIGIQSASERNVEVIDNVITNSPQLRQLVDSGIGIHLAKTTDSLVQGNSSSGNGWQGFQLGGERITVADNTASGNTDEGFFVSGDGFEIVRNKALNNHSGFVLHGENHTVANNTATGNTYDGIHTSLLVDSTFEQNDSSFNGIGFRLETSNLGNQYRANTAHGNANWGFWVETPDLGLYSSNRCINNGLGGSVRFDPSEADLIPLRLCSEAGYFTDDDDSVFELDIEWMAEERITTGCNPPSNDEYCPEESVTRGQMAAFLVRALGLTDRLDDPFIDDDDSVFEADIEKLAAAGITRGCNPTEGNTKYCPDAKVTRGQMAAFLVRAMGYTDDGGGDLFVDDDDSVFEHDIDCLGTAGVTKGCNPAEGNTRFCPDGYVSRGQMAAFLHRALG